MMSGRRVVDGIGVLGAEHLIPFKMYAWINLLERKRAGEHYAVIDNEVVWYGNVNPLSKEDAADNLMRVCSKDIDAELLAMTFCYETEL